MARARRSIEIDVPPEKFFEVLQDYPRYPEFLPEVKAIRMGPRTGNAVDVTYWLDVKLKVIEYTLRHVETSPSQITWSLVRGEVFKRDEGSWTLVPTPGGGTTATYSIELDMGRLVPAAVEKALAEHGLPNMLANFKARAEKLWQARPA